ncbi:hypothetical protein FBU59_006326 [Linderina macrospora]|uniref:Uncharacterized protein n=1 Tax=Linderina macrospora TaxID=4868 RepID=A0ACC1J0B6_9FUNG|nr:hypothetical protein FBU59_006326 [Linderina macrospora]
MSDDEEDMSDLSDLGESPVAQRSRSRSPGGFPVKPRGGKGGRRAPGQRTVVGSADEADDGFDFPRGGIEGPRQLHCVCRRGSAEGEAMVKCGDCQGKKFSNVAIIRHTPACAPVLRVPCHGTLCKPLHHDIVLSQNRFTLSQHGHRICPSSPFM